MTSPVAESGLCAFVRGWLVDMTTVYTIGITRTATILTALALGNVVIGGVMMALDKRESLWRGFGLWTGFILIVCGITCLAMRQKRPTNFISVLSIACFVGLLTSLATLITSAVNLASLYDDPASLYPEYVIVLPEYKISLCTMNAVLLALSLLETSFLCLAVCLTTGYEWPCLNVNTPNIFTITIDVNRDDRILTADPDTEMSAFSTAAARDANGRQRSLSAQADRLQRTPRETELSR